MYPSYIVLVRHAEAVTDPKIPTWDLGLTERGKKQAKFIRQSLHCDFNSYYCSTYRRSQETMKIMYPNVQPTVDSRLNEAHWGIWNDMTEDEIAQKYQEEIARKNKYGWYHYRAIGGENWPDVELRAHSFLQTLINNGHNSLVVGHGNWMIAFKKIVLQLSVAKVIEMHDQQYYKNASVTVYHSTEYHEELRLEKENTIPWDGKV
ncbi:MAG: phosphoglycerate mutase family protein [Parcubacteria group bacterium]|nr:phosphoglycerate mutase family protein [Parcubacteria group bacterium]